MFWHVFFILSFPGFPSAYAEEQVSVTIHDGNIYYSRDGAEAITLTSAGRDRAPILSPNGKMITFIRKSFTQADYLVGSQEDWETSAPMADQIWIIQTNGQNGKLIVKEKVLQDRPEGRVAHISDESLKFSPDGRSLYFISDAWVTSGAIHVVDMENASEKFLLAGNSIEVISRGERKGCLIVNQHRYFLGGGSYDWFWLFEPNGTEIGPIGPDITESQKDVLGLKV